jgi:hypothetical protein
MQARQRPDFGKKRMYYSIVWKKLELHIAFFTKYDGLILNKPDCKWNVILQNTALRFKLTANQALDATKHIGKSAFQQMYRADSAAWDFREQGMSEDDFLLTHEVRNFLESSIRRVSDLPQK